MFIKRVFEIKVPRIALPVLLAVSTLLLPASSLGQNYDHALTTKKLFARIPNFKGPSKGRTFVFFIQGAADHFVFRSMNDTKRTFRADAYDAQRIQNYAMACRDCNVVVLHIQRGGSRWYTRSAPWATYLRVYSGGKKRLSRHVPMLNGAEPSTISRLLQFSEDLFPETETHFIYRGHSFVPAYDPTQASPSPSGLQVLPFDFNFKQSSYGIDSFVGGIREAQLHRKLASVVLASCSMAYLELARRLSAFADVMIASEVNLSENLEAGFNFSFLTDLQHTAAEGDVRRYTQAIAESLVKNFSEGPFRDDAMLEAPMTWADLSAISAFSSRWDDYLLRVQLAKSDIFGGDLSKLQEVSQVQRWLSDRYLKVLKSEGKSESHLIYLSKNVVKKSLLESQLDLGLFINALLDQNRSPELGSALQDDLDFLRQNVRVFNASSLSRKLGLAVFKLLPKNGQAARAN